MASKKVTVETTVDLPAEKVWELWTRPEHITQWNYAADTWHCPRAKNDLRPGGKFSWRMEAKDGSMGFDYSGEYNEVIPHKHISSTLDDGRKVSVRFTEYDGKTRLTENFETDNAHSIEQQKTGWQAILDNFRNYASKAH
ncbi:Uncharacterized conserved protein YndB, AHSA1/START domain [Salinimicrobium catena]|uniref:Uncharacterized conserved protein YndB, AHSA1/START domain n=1 Tax=Salinimicrobium catena TaxID=390640 RepID=A0A1H5PKM8_9FLAO|nr:SRPBCC family protein [Salinimicrobium catena]SDL88271.1 Uncharacterized conserved protein YndB, AHSA1/START domain [Salinimicrobium catena]SEF13661.1 Uncharacterized conserved protein YndB, AHSA1/START domain [Salinimicrobium catena]